MNEINKLIHDIHSGLTVAENGGDVADYLPYLERLERLVARIPAEPELMQGFDADGIEKMYRAEGYVWCSCDGRWRQAEYLTCGCEERDAEDLEADT